jgi:hypothetical protein
MNHSSEIQITTTTFVEIVGANLRIRKQRISNLEHSRKILGSQIYLFIGGHCDIIQSL